MNLRQLSIELLLKPKHSFKSIDEYASFILGKSTKTPMLYESFLTVYFGLAALEYINVNADGIKLAPKGALIYKDKERKELLATVPWIIPNKMTPNWDKAFDALMEIERSFADNSKRVKVLIDDNIPRIKNVIDSLNDKQKYNFYVSLQDQMEQEALKDIEDK